MQLVLVVLIGFGWQSSFAANTQSDLAKALATAASQKKLDLNPSASQEQVESVPQVSQPLPEEIGYLEGVINKRLAGGGHLKQFGYNVFSSSTTTFAPVTEIPIPPEYVLGPGDELKIQYYGSRSDTLSLTVDRNGVVNLPEIGEMGLAGMTFNAAKAVLAEQISKRLTGVTSSINMGRLRSIRIFVLGDVRSPGSYLVSGLSTLTHALFVSGGASKNGSLRHVQLKRQGKKIAEIDLYDFFLKGDGRNDRQLLPGDVVFVPPIGQVVAVGGEVARPGIYELQREKNINEIIALAGGVIHTADKARVEIDRLEKSGSRKTVNFDLDAANQSAFIQNGDIVQIHSLPAVKDQYVVLSGAVKRPAQYGYKPNMKMSDLIGSQDNWLPESYLKKVEITHHMVENGEQRVTSRDEVNLESLFAGGGDIALQPYDEVLVRAIADWGETLKVTLNGQVKFPGVYSLMKGETLASLVDRAGGFTQEAYLPALVLTRESIRKQQFEENKRIIKQIETEIARFELDIVDTRDKDLMGAKQRSLSQAQKMLKEMQSVQAVGRLIIDVPMTGAIKGTSADIALRDGDIITIPEKPGEVLVLGQVYNPAALSFNNKISISEYVDMAGGVTPNAKEDGVYIVRASGIVVAGKKVRNAQIQPGDVIIVPEDLDKLDLLDGTLSWTKVLFQIGVSLASMKAIKVF
jgi:protein involved in polysaccharide export with SLBB domain